MISRVLLLRLGSCCSLTCVSIVCGSCNVHVLVSCVMLSLCASDERLILYVRRLLIMCVFYVFLLSGNYVMLDRCIKRSNSIVCYNVTSLIDIA